MSISVREVSAVDENILESMYLGNQTTIDTNMGFDQSKDFNTTQEKIDCIKSQFEIDDPRVRIIEMLDEGSIVGYFIGMIMESSWAITNAIVANSAYSMPNTAVTEVFIALVKDFGCTHMTSRVTDGTSSATNAANSYGLTDKLQLVTTVSSNDVDQGVNCTEYKYLLL
tara:strand:- start:146 stop:652 length:507 start_codon:yes stop_codon:yes gene_type:complete